MRNDDYTWFRVGVVLAWILVGLFYLLSSVSAQIPDDVDIPIDRILRGQQIGTPVSPLAYGLAASVSVGEPQRDALRDRIEVAPEAPAHPLAFPSGQSKSTTRRRIVGS